MHLMCDIETLSTQPNAAILSIGACVFDRDGVGKTFYRVISEDTITGHIDPKTVLWWFKQSDAARGEFTKGHGRPHTEVLSDFAAFCATESGGKELHPWSNGAGFDIVILESAYAAANMRTPWKYNGPLDVRTIMWEACARVNKAEGIEHHALDDAINQAKAVLKALHASGRWTPSVPPMSVEKLLEAVK